MHLRKRLSLLLAVWLCLPFLTPAKASEDEEGRENRALLLGCDRFVSQTDTTPSAANNVGRMASALSGGTMNLQTLVTRAEGVATTGELAGLILDAFSDADADDVSIFYISTHGVWEESLPGGGMTLLLSDGVTESGVTALEATIYHNNKYLGV